VTAKGLEARQRIIAAAETLFSVRGFERTSMRDIASEAGMQAASMYYHFPSKDELLWAVWEKGGVELLQTAIDAACSVGDPWSRMEAVCVAHITGLLDWRKTNQVLFVMPPSQYPSSIRDRVIALRDEYERVFASVVSDLPMKDGTDKDLFRLTLIGALSWSLYWFKPGGDSPEVIAQQMLNLMRVGVQ
jgi:AcrR family transcriptional regulator